eukprot:3522907-Rhodomonas_salina.1
MRFILTQRILTLSQVATVSSSTALTVLAGSTQYSATLQYCYQARQYAAAVPAGFQYQAAEPVVSGYGRLEEALVVLAVCARRTIAAR